MIVQSIFDLDCHLITKKFAYNCRLLKRNKFTESTFTNDDGSIKIKTLQGRYVNIYHQQDLSSCFQDFTFYFD